VSKALFPIALSIAIVTACRMAFDVAGFSRYAEIESPRRWPELFLHPAGTVARARVGAFLICIGAFLAFAAAIVVHECFLLVAKRSQYPSLYQWLRWTVFCVTAGGALCLAYGFKVEPSWLSTTHVHLETSKLPRGATAKFAVISDLHMDREAKLEGKLPGAIAPEKPDAIFFLGDAMNSTWALGPFKQLMFTLRQIAPVVAVLGNQDEGAWWESHDPYRGTPVLVLKNASTALNIRGASIYVWGQDSTVPWLPPGAIRPVHLIPPPGDAHGSYAIVLNHTPDLIDQASRGGYDLYLAGHTHGGQIALPFYGALVTNSRFDKQYEAGQFQVGPTTLYVNRGLGFARWPQPEARFFARPELTIIEITGAANAAHDPRQ